MSLQDSNSKTIGQLTKMAYPNAQSHGIDKTQHMNFKSDSKKTNPLNVEDSSATIDFNISQSRIGEWDHTKPFISTEKS